MDVETATAAAIVVVVAIGLLLMGKVSVGQATGGAPSPALQALAAAIAQAENVPASANNPGALVLGDQGLGVFNSAGVTIFSSAEAGLNALYNELNLVAGGLSKNFNLNMTISEFAQKWTGGDNPTGWANTVAGALGVTTDTTLAQILGEGNWPS